MFMLVIVIVTGVLRGGKGKSLSCYSCGKLSSDLSMMEDCINTTTTTLITCMEGEACVTYTRNYNEVSAPIRGCFPINSSLPSFGPAPLLSSSVCEVQKAGTVSACICTSTGCNDDGISFRKLNQLPRKPRDAASLSSVTCPVLTVTNADFADCNGDYSVTEERVAWAGDRPVYAHADKDRFIFWNAGGLGWSIGKREYLSSGSHWHRSGLDSREPWQGEWEDGAMVRCKGEECVWSGYSVWSGCDVSCGVGRQVRKRRILQPAGEGGEECTGSEEETRACQAAPCPVDCQWAGYGAWSTCSQTCGGGTRSRRRGIARRAQAGGRDCEGDREDVKFCQTQACQEASGSAESGVDISGSCCKQLRVGSTGNARIDQALYMGIYTRLARDFNGRAVYKREGRDPLYVYFFTSQRDQLSLWVIGPQLGQFIAGIRNSKAGSCVHDLKTGWKYASRAGVWEDNDPSLTVTCYNTAPSRSTQPTSLKKEISDVIDQVFTATTKPPAKEKRRNCVWSRYGSWSECSQSCGGGEQVRVRRVKTQAAGGGRECRGGTRERRKCNQVSCPARITTTSRRTTEADRIQTTTRTSTTKRTTTRKPNTTTKGPKPQNSRVQCWVCGSLFSTDAPDCPSFNKQDPKQLKTCDIGEACLYYSWKKSNTDISVIRECFPTSILLGSIDDPVEPQEECNPESVESDTINACICTSDFCNGIGEDNVSKTSSLPSIKSGSPKTTTERSQEISTRQSPARSSLDRVQCHQCGSLFSSSSNNPDCDVFDESDPLQQNYCQPGEACLWYSWQKSRSSKSFIRECFSTSILLGSIDDPLVTKSFCDPKDISDGPQSKITACLCDSDLCNSYRGSGEKRPELLPVHILTQNDPIPLSSPGGRQALVPPEEPRKASTRNRNKNSRKDNSTQKRKPESQESSRNAAQQTFHPDQPGLQCYSCGSLLNPNKKCETFDREDKTQVQTCLKDEACLMYSWKKSSTETATLRECFPTRVLLGSIRDPLVPLPNCSQRDITDDGSGSISACLCNTDFCNDEKNLLGLTSKSNNGRVKTQQKTTRQPQSPRRTTKRTITTTKRAFPPRIKPQPSKTERQQIIRRSCPQDFDLVAGGCYLISNERVGWIEARKKCQQREAILLSLETDSEKQKVVEYVASSTRRRRSEYWLGGNDIEEEGVWEWASRRTPVPGFGWSEEPYNSYEENCLAWTVTNNGPSDSRDGWHGSSCCNNLRYICQL